MKKITDHPEVLDIKNICDVSPKDKSTKNICDKIERNNNVTSNSQKGDTKKVGK